VARQPRIDWPGAVHHVMARGIERRQIFLDDRDRVDLVARMRAILPECGAVLYAWVFMLNHFHLVVRTGHVSLSKLMKRLNTGFAMRFNRRHGRVGYVFQNRFKSRLENDEADLAGLIRYVHMNPVKAGLIADLRSLESWRWSGHAALVGRREPLEFEDVSYPLSRFAEDAPVARESLRRWMTEWSDLPEAAARYETFGPVVAAPPLIVPDVDRTLDALIQRTCNWYAVRREDLLRGARATRISRARALICYVAVVELRFSQTHVASHVGVSQAAVCQAIARGAVVAREDRPPRG
jgi:REP element-mobilizing transposase RayT